MSTLSSPPRPTDPTSRAVRLIMDAPHFDAHRADWIDPHVQVHDDMLTGKVIEGWDFAAILAWPWGGLRIAVKAAADIYNQSGRAFLSDVIVQLDHDLQARVLEALRIRWGIEPHDLGEDLDHACVVCTKVGGHLVKIAEATDVDGVSARPLFAHPHCVIDDEGEAIPA